MEKLRIAPSTIPTYTMTLPLTGMTVKYRPFLVKEEKILLIALQSTDPEQIITAIRNLVLGCTNNQLDTKKIPAADASYAMLQIRARSLGEEIKPYIQCGHCDTKTPIKINIQNIGIRKKVEEEKSPLIKINDDISLVMRFPTIHDLDIKQDETQMIFKMVYSCIDKVHYKEKVYDRGEVKEEDIQLFVDSLLPDQFKEMVAFIQSATTVLYEFTYSCPHCKQKVMVSMENIGDFFL